MTSGLRARIVPDKAFVLDPRHLGISVKGRDLEKLFADFCQHNRQSPWQFELSSEGEIIIMPPTMFPSGAHENNLSTDLAVWGRGFGGVSTGPSAGYRMSDGSVLSPDAAWISPERWENHDQPSGEWILLCPSHENDLATDLRIWSRKFGGVSTGASAGFLLPDQSVLSPDAAWISPERWENHYQPSGKWILLCPDFVVEIRSGSDNIAPLRAKMQFYLANAARLGWLIDPQNRRVYIYREGQEEPEVLEDPETISGEGVLPGFTFEIARWIFNVT
jgi:Uma2 family endonuclease